MLASIREADTNASCSCHSSGMAAIAPKRTFTDRLLKFKVVVQLNVAIAIVIWTVDVQIELDSA